MGTRVNAREREVCIIDSDDNGEHITERMAQAIERRKKNGLPPAFSLAIDATKNAKGLEVSQVHGKVIGGAHSHHLVNIEGRTKRDVQEILDGNSKAHGKITVASEIKVTAMSFQNSPAGIPTIKVVASRPQTNNESNTFCEAHGELCWPGEFWRQSKFCQFLG